MNTETPESDEETSHCVCNARHEKDTTPRSLAVRLETERDRARAEAERWRDNWKNGRTISMIVSTKLPWENDKIQP